MEKLLRSEAEAALDDLAEACEAAADHYRAAAQASDDERLAAFFREMEERRSTWGERLREQIRLMGNLPSEPDADREAMDRLLIRVRAAFSRDRRRFLLEDCRDVEQGLAVGIERAADAGEELPPRVHEVMDEIRQDVSATLRRLGEIDT